MMLKSRATGQRNNYRPINSGGAVAAERGRAGKPLARQGPLEARLYRSRIRKGVRVCGCHRSDYTPDPAINTLFYWILRFVIISLPRTIHSVIKLKFCFVSFIISITRISAPPFLTKARQVAARDQRPEAIRGLQAQVLAGAREI